jgi:acyl-CoA synthetase (AMP-forming)/AMP-acid ligase II
MSEQAHLRSCQTLSELLHAQARAGSRVWDFKLVYQQSDLPSGLTRSGNDMAVDLSYADLLELATRAARRLQRAGVGPGARVLIVLPTGLGWLAAFFGCQLLGAAAVPLVPPWSLDRLQEHAERMARVATVCEPAACVIEPALMSVLEATQSAAALPLRALTRLTPAELFEEAAGSLVEPTIDPSAPAFIQFTSGSTADPKGVVISQRAVLANCDFIGRRLGTSEHDIGCSWLPLFHDMGLIGHVLVPLCFGTQSVLIPPEVFARQPRTWLEVVTRYRATMTTAPNSAYDMCATKLTDRDLSRVDLSSLRKALCGAEPILPATLSRFAQRLAGHGFREAMFTPVYGLAEVTLAATISEGDTGPRVCRFDRQRLEHEGQAVLASDPVLDGIELVAVGRPESPQGLRIVDEQGRELSEGRIGEIQVGGDSVMSEYFRNAPATRQAFQDGHVRTGDFGFVLDGELFVVGRRKETIIKGGRNLYPYDIEAAAANVAGVRKGRVVALGVSNPATGTQDVVLLFETKQTLAEQQKQLMREVKAAVFAATQVHLDQLELLPPGTLLKTSSGKLRRAEIRERYLHGTLKPERASRLLAARAYWAVKWSKLRGKWSGRS